MQIKPPRMKMLNYMLEHEAAVIAVLSTKEPAEGQLDQLLREHDLKLAWFQHERLVHLLIMILSILLFLIMFCLLLILDIPLLFVLVLLLGVLSAAYIFHYFQLENTVQRGYLLRDKISQRIRTQRQEQTTQKTQMARENRPPVSQ